VSDFLAILRDADPLTDVMVARPFVEGVCLCLAEVAPTEGGRFGVTYAMKASPPSDEAWHDAAANATTGLMIKGMREQDHEYIVVERENGLATAILAEPGFATNVCEWLQTDRFLVGWSVPDFLVLWRPDSPFSDELGKRILSAGTPGAINLSPAVVLYSDGGFTRT
jgi:hypothetical protein